MKSLLRHALALVGSAALPFFVSAQTPAGSNIGSSGTGPVIQFTKETNDFGKAIANDSVAYTFVVTNAGDATLDLLSIKPGCSCTVLNGSWTEHIPPHGTGVIPVSVHTSGTGAIDKPITVTSNDKARPTVVLHMVGVVWLPIEITPSQTFPPHVNFTVKPNAPSVPPQTLKIYNRTDEPLVLQPPQTTSDAFSAVLTTNVPGREFALKISLNKTTPDKDPKTGSYIPTYPQGAITITTSSTNMPLLTITALADIQPEVRVSPPQVQIAAGPLPRALTNNIHIQNNTSKTLKILNASVNVPGVSVAIATLTTNQNYTIVLGFPQGFQIPASQKIKATIHTDNANYSTIEVPINQVQPPQRRPLTALPGAVPSHN